MISLLLIANLLCAAPQGAPASAPAKAIEALKKTEITPETRPELFSDTPPPRYPASAEAEQPPSTTSFWITMLVRTTLVLGAVVLLAYLLLNKGLGKLMKLTGAKSAGRNMTLLERMPIGQKNALIVVEVDGRKLLLGVGEAQVNLIAELGTQAGAAWRTQKNAFSPASAKTGTLEEEPPAS